MSIPWVVSRPEIKVLDCTVRDGGLINNHQFDDAVVRAVYEACVAASIDYMEIGYKNSSRIFSVDENGYWKFCHEDDIRRIVDDNPSEMKLACMIDAGKSDWKTDVLPKDKSVLDLIRVAFYDYQIDEAVDMIQDAYQKGYEVSANLMAVTNVDEVNLDRVLEILIKTPASTIVVVDSYGALLPEQTKYLTKKYLRFAQLADKIVGIHAHNNQQLAFANSIEAIRNGAIRVDATIGGLGRGAGNCPMELLLGYLHNPKYKLRPIYQCMEEQFLELQRKIEWGPFPEFIMTGQFNQHPRAAIQVREGEKRDHYTEFFDMLLKEQESEVTEEAKR